MRLSALLLLRRENGGRGVLFDPADGRTSFLNPVAMLICTLLQERELSYPELLGELRRRVTELPPAAPEEIRGFLQELQTRGYLAVRDGDLPAAGE